MKIRSVLLTVPVIALPPWVQCTQLPALSAGIGDRGH